MKLHKSMHTGVHGIRVITSDDMRDYSFIGAFVYKWGFCQIIIFKTDAKFRL